MRQMFSEKQILEMIQKLINTSLGGLKFYEGNPLTEEQYEALGDHPSNTIYLIVEE